MTPSTVAHVREAAGAYAGAAADLVTASGFLQTALSDFNSRDGAVADQVTEAGGLAATEILTATGADAGDAPQSTLDEVAADDADTRADQAWQNISGVNFDDRRYVDWSTIDPDDSADADPEDDCITVELGSGEGGIGVSVTRAELRLAHAAMAVSLLAHATADQPADTHVGRLVASLTALHNPEGFWSEDDRRIHWIRQTGDGRMELTIGDADDSGCIDMSWDDLAQLHEQLTQTFLAYAEFA